MVDKMNKGFFITFEGPEGSGKSTHSARLYKELLADGYDVVHTAEPGGTELGVGIRDLLLKKDSIRLDDHAELFLFEADRAQHVTEFIKPSLKKKKVVLCDRFNTATFAYQGYGLGICVDLIKSVDSIATDGLVPDLTILMDIDVDTGMSRAKARGSADRMEKREREFHENVRQGYLDIARQCPERIKVINTDGDIDDVYRRVKKEVYDLIGKCQRAG